ncbi:hypothetical protein BUE80_DR010087 [Diplocarpon rosae]|nr:hypothetical protein BUE80_DR010087 [Diplocarpon rosae]
MSTEQYAAVPLDEHDPFRGRSLKELPSARQTLQTTIGLAVGVVLVFGVGFGAGQNWSAGKHIKDAPIWSEPSENRLLSPQAFLPQIPTNEVKFAFPTKYGETGAEGDQLWSEMMPNGAGFVRVPYPRRFDMPPSKSIENDPEDGEIYSLSITHQLHCLAVVRHVIMKYEKHDKSPYAGDGHEYHCIDYRKTYSISTPHTLTMAKKTKRRAYAWKKDIQVMTCLLRLRCQPPVPYHLIAALLLRTSPSVPKRVVPKEAGLERSSREWLEKYLQEVYDGSEKWESEAWKVARNWNATGVREMLKSAGLDIQGRRFVVMREDELVLQIKWRREGDWRAGSTPLQSWRHSEKSQSSVGVWETDISSLESGYALLCTNNAFDFQEA